MNTNLLIPAAELTALIRSFPDVQYKEYVFADQPYLNFPKSYDVYGDGALVIVPGAGAYARLSNYFHYASIGATPGDDWRPGLAAGGRC